MTQIPISIEEINVEWLSHVLCADNPAAEVSGFMVEDAHVGTTGRALLRLEYRGGADLPERLFVKLPPNDEQQREFVAQVGMGKKEARFYRDLAAEMPLPVPRCYHADFNESGDRYIMLLENLEDRDCTFRNASTRYSADYIRSVLRVFARLHAKFWNSERFDEDLSWVNSPVFHPISPVLVSNARQQYAAEMPPVFADMADYYVDNAEAIHALWDTGVPTLVHGDIHDGNMYFDPGYRLTSEEGGSPGFLDWGIVSRNSCMRDVAYFLAGTPATEDRRSHLSAWLHEYFEALHACGVVALDRETLLREFRWHSAYVWVGAAVTLAMGSEWQSIGYVKNTLTRVNQALEDSDVLSALRETIG